MVIQGHSKAIGDARHKSISPSWRVGSAASPWGSGVGVEEAWTCCASAMQGNGVRMYREELALVLPSISLDKKA